MPRPPKSKNVPRKKKQPKPARERTDAAAGTAGRPSSLVDTRVVWCGDWWIGIDISPTACRVMAKRLRDVCHMRESEPGWKAKDTRCFVIRDLPWTVDKLKAIPPFEFENWAVIALSGVPNKVQVGDMGIDGRIYPVGTRPSGEGSKKTTTGHTGASMFAGDWFPVQVKQAGRVGRPDIDAFEAAMAREDRQRGFLRGVRLLPGCCAGVCGVSQEDGEVDQTANRAGDSGRGARAEDVRSPPTPRSPRRLRLFADEAHHEAPVNEPSSVISRSPSKS